MTSLQFCMDPSNWQQGVAQMDSGLKTSQGRMVSISATQTRIEPAASSSSSLMASSQQQQQQEQQQNPQENNTQEALRCPRCDSTNTKFCYYNNYSLSQPRHFCKTCRRYWTRGGALRNVPVGGGCRKNKRNKRSLSLSGLHVHSPLFTPPNSSSSLSISLPATPSKISSDLNILGTLNQSHSNSIPFLYGLPSDSNNEFHIPFSKIHQVNLRNSADYALSINPNVDSFLPNFVRGAELGSFGVAGNSVTGFDCLEGETCIPWSSSEKISLPILQSQPLGGFEEGHKTKVKAEDDYRDAVNSQWQITEVSGNDIDNSANLFQGEGSHGSGFWNGAPGWPDLSSFGSSGSASPLV